MLHKLVPPPPQFTQAWFHLVLRLCSVLCDLRRSLRVTTPLIQVSGPQVGSARWAHAPPPARGLGNLVLSSDHLEAFRPRVYVGRGGGGGVEGSAAFLSEPTAEAAKGKGGRWAQEET